MQDHGEDYNVYEVTKGEKLKENRLGSAMWISYILLQRSIFYCIPSSAYTKVGPPSLSSAEQKADTEMSEFHMGFKVTGQNWGKGSKCHMHPHSQG